VSHGGSLNHASFAELVRRAMAIPPHRIAARAARFAQRRALGFWRRRQDISHGSHSRFHGVVHWQPRVSIMAADIAPQLHEPLRLLGDHYRAHRFDLLGSGRVKVQYGMSCAGFAGHVYPPQPSVHADPEGAWLRGQVNGSNLAAARDLWRRVADATYQPIDWQLDFRSGYRWRADAHFSTLPIPVDTGADVKVPWELGRLQHLPQLALCAILAESGTAGFAPAQEYVHELRCQLLDFLALNPPRFGVNWMCPMDVGIRIANILVALDLLIGARIDPGQDLIECALGSARDHATHIADHLEWAESGRGNHYLANLVGLLWAASHLPADDRTDAIFAFAAAGLLREAELQFGADGGNHEGSTNYHRLSSELVLFGVARLTGLSEDELSRLDHARDDALRVRVPWRPGPLRRYPLPDGGTTLVPPIVRERLFSAAEVMRAVTRPDGHVIQVGDTDSGRLFKLTPVGTSEGAAHVQTFRENTLDHRATVAGIGALFRIADDTRTLDAIVISRLAGGRACPQPALIHTPDHGDLDAVVAAIEALPPECRRCRRLAVDGARETWRRAALPDFGLYVFATDRDFIAFRCAGAPKPDAPLGHTHDDNLAIEYVLGDASRIDPGTLCYTPSRTLRDLYRSADAHDVVRAADWDVAPAGSALFGLSHKAWATCLAWRPHGVAGEIAAPQGRLLRALRLTETGLEIWDGVEPPDRLRPIKPPIEVATGYGMLRECPGVTR
jgi:hypothetical protein